MNLSRYHVKTATGSLEAKSKVLSTCDLDACTSIYIYEYRLQVERYGISKSCKKYCNS